MRVLTPEAIPVGEMKAVLGEGAFWSAEDDALLWVDILGKKVFRTHSDSGRTEGDIAYWADTYLTKRQIWRARYDVATGQIREKRPFAQLPEALGRPDGAAVDADGCYWVAAVWGWQLLRYTPYGELDLAVRLPVQRPSKLCFGGPDLKTIYVTSISDGLGEDAPQTQPLAGRLLAIDVGIQGLPPVRFHLA